MLLMLGSNGPQRRPRGSPCRGKDHVRPREKQLGKRRMAISRCPRDVRCFSFFNAVAVSGGTMVAQPRNATPGFFLGSLLATQALERAFSVGRPPPASGGPDPAHMAGKGYSTITFEREQPGPNLSA